MNFSEFANILYPFCAEGQLPSEFVKTLVDKIMTSPVSKEDIEASENDTYNPLSLLKIDTLNRIYNGKHPISKRSASAIKGKIDKHQFATYINSKPIDVQLEMATSIQKHILDFDSDDVGESCAEVFSKVLDDIFTGNSHSTKSTSSVTKDKKHIHEVTATTVYLDHSDGKIHIGNESISIPKEFLPPDDIAVQENIYVNALFAAYGDAENREPITIDDLPSLSSKKYERNFKNQRKNFYKAEHLHRSVREVFVDSDKQFDILKNDTLEYIQETYEGDYKHGYERLIKVLERAVDSRTTSILDSVQNMISPSVRKGICHMLVNDKELTWVLDNE